MHDSDPYNTLLPKTLHTFREICTPTLLPFVYTYGISPTPFHSQGDQKCNIPRNASPFLYRMPLTLLCTAGALKWQCIFFALTPPYATLDFFAPSTLRRIENEMSWGHWSPGHFICMCIAKQQTSRRYWGCTPYTSFDVKSDMGYIDKEWLLASYLWWWYAVRSK